MKKSGQEIYEHVIAQIISSTFFRFNLNWHLLSFFVLQEVEKNRL